MTRYRFGGPGGRGGRCCLVAGKAAGTLTGYSVIGLGRGLSGDDGGTLLPSCREGGRDVERLFGYCVAPEKSQQLNIIDEIWEYCMR